MVEVYVLGGLILAILVAYISLNSKIASVREDFREIKGAWEQYAAAPVLRQYVERSVPVLMTREQENEVKARLAEREKEFEATMNFGIAPKKVEPMVSEEDLV